MLLPLQPHLCIEPGRVRHTCATAATATPVRIWMRSRPMPQQAPLLPLQPRGGASVKQNVLLSWPSAVLNEVLVVASDSA